MSSCILGNYCLQLFHLSSQCLDLVCLHYRLRVFKLVKSEDTIVWMAADAAGLAWLGTITLLKICDQLTFKKSLLLRYLIANAHLHFTNPTLCTRKLQSRGH
jgi:hypothetical protein